MHDRKEGAMGSSGGRAFQEKETMQKAQTAGSGSRCTVSKGDKWVLIWKKR